MMPEDAPFVRIGRTVLKCIGWALVILDLAAMLWR